MALEQLDLFGNPVVVETSKKEKSKLVQQPLFEAVFNDDVTEVNALAPAVNEISAKPDAFAIETVETITEIVVAAKAIALETTPQAFVYTDNNIRVKVKA
jgi:hypothetical protein